MRDVRGGRKEDEENATSVERGGLLFVTFKTAMDLFVSDLKTRADAMDIH